MPPPSTSAQLVRRLACGLLLVVVLTSATVVLAAGAARVTVLHPDTVESSARTVADDLTVRRVLGARIAAAVDAELLGEDGRATLAAAGIEPRLDLESAARAALDAPELRAELVRAAEELRRALFDDHRSAVTVDISATVPVMRATAAERDPLYAEVLPEEATLRIVLADRVPDWTAMAPAMERLAPLAAVAAAVALLLAVAVHPRHVDALRVASVGLVAVAVVAAAAAVALPTVVTNGPAPETGAVLAALAEGLVLRLVAMAALAGLVGAAGVAAAALWSRALRRAARDREASRLGAEAFLAGDAAAGGEDALAPGAVRTASLRSPRGMPAPRPVERSPLPPDGLFSDLEVLRPLSDADRPTSDRVERAAPRGEDRPRDA